MSEETTFECKECHLHYRTEELATACAEACKGDVCDNEITAQSIERSEELKQEAASSESEENVPAEDVVPESDGDIRDQAVKAKVAEADAETEVDFEAKWKRALADYQNLTKEMSAERIRMRKNALRDVVEQLIPILDNFSAATAQEPETDDAKVKNWVMGVGFIRKQMEDMLAEFGVMPIETVGKPFDANLMEAVGEEEAPSNGVHSGKSGTVLRETSQGYTLGETVIRPAKVITVK